ncbi:glycoside hydrolase [bacterium]|nr:glycoside hydrolase [candidate division CSSED10-310 bacterium]
MSSDSPLHVAFLWHMHQPSYRILGSNRLLLPWVRLHAVKDYWGMLRLVREFPGLRVTFNFVPILLDQLLAYVNHDAVDRIEELTRIPATELNNGDRIEILEKFFRCHHETMILPYPRYRELLMLRGGNGDREVVAERAHYLSGQDYRDLQVWYNLTWCHNLLKKQDPFLRGLLEKASGFSEEEKLGLLEKHREIMAGLIDQYAGAVHDGQIEMSASPYYHPILPLLVDTNLALQANDRMVSPRIRFAYPDDAQEQVMRSRSLFQRLFGTPPRGMWPSEGSVAQDLVPLLRAAGIEWMASDEGVLARSLGTPFLRTSMDNPVAVPSLYRPYWVGRDDTRVAVVFRDHVLSDLVGFVYSRWEPSRAVDDCIKRLHAIHRQTAGQAEPAIVFIILDGENAWEYYPDGGVAFLRGLYGRMLEEKWLEPVTISGFLDAHPPRRMLEHLTPGSWINANFDIWIGKPEKNQAWEMLAEAREACREESDDALRAKGMEALYVAEGSDWFWWYDDDHFTEERASFDALFREYVAESYKARGQKPPEHLHHPIAGARRTGLKVQQPTAFVHPQLTGKLGSYFEWLYAGTFEEEQRFGAIHPSQPKLINKVFFGFDEETFYLRLDPGKQDVPEKRVIEGSLRIIFAGPTETSVEFTMSGPGELIPTASGETKGVRGRYREIFEIAVSFAAMKVRAGDEVKFHIILNLKGGWMERYPSAMDVSFTAPGQDFESTMWSAL